MVVLTVGYVAGIIALGLFIGKSMVSAIYVS